MWLTALAIRRPVVIWTAMAAITLLGIVAYLKLPAELMPRASVPTISVITVFPAASPEEVEKQITRPIEDATGLANGVRHIYSSSQESVSIVSLDFQPGTDVDSALADVRDRVERTRASLPREALTPTVAKLDVNSQPVLYAAITAPTGTQRLRRIAEARLRPALVRLEGVAAVTMQGGDGNEVRVLAVPERLAQAGVTVQDVADAVAGAGRNVPAGSVTVGGQRAGVRTEAAYRSPAEIAQAQVLTLPLLAGSLLQDLPIPSAISTRGTRPILVGDVADIVVAPSDATALTRADGRPCLTVVVSKAPDANAIRVAEQARRVLQEVVRGGFPRGTAIVIGRDEAAFVRDALEDVNVTLALGALLATLSVLLFLRSLRGTIIVALALPSSILATYIVMYFAGFTLNQMTLLALSLSVGILVDDSIVVLESITRHRRMGEPPVEAAFNGRTEIGFAGITLTLTDVVVFLPIAFMGGIVGIFFREFGLTVVAATLFSLVVSFTITPTLAAHWHERARASESVERMPWHLDRLYLWAARKALAQPWTALGWGATALAAVVLVTSPLLGTEFLPASDQGQIGITIEAPATATLGDTDRVAQQVEAQVRRDPDVEHVITTVGEIVAGFGAIPRRGPQYAQISVRLKDRFRPEHVLTRFGTSLAKFRGRTDQQIAADLRRRLEAISGARIAVAPVRTVANVGPDIQIELRGSDMADLHRAATAVRNRLASIRGVVDPDISLRIGQPELRVRADRTLSAAAGVPPSQAGAVLRAAVVGVEAGTMQWHGDDLPIRVRVADPYLTSSRGLLLLPVGTSGRRVVTLGEIARIEQHTSASEIARMDGLRQATVTAGLAPGYALGTVRTAIERAVGDALPQGVTMSFGGESGVLEENLPYFLLALSLAVVLVYLVMAALFNSVVSPLIIMLTLPMALVGGLAALALAGETLSLVSAIGVIMLVGLMGRNAILLVDYANTLRARGRPVPEAALEAGRTRLRPILMTTLTTILGMMPVALRMGRASELRAPMAIVVIGGLVVSTVLTLVVIPAAYVLVHGRPKVGSS